MNDILVSIIVPVYGTEAYLSACIDSIRNQTYSNLQIILVDDQSPDHCPEICDDYAEKDSRIQVVHQDNMGVSGARNTGMTLVLGDYVMFVDSDDILTPIAVETMLHDAAVFRADIVWAPIMNHCDQFSLNLDSECESYYVYQSDESLLLSLDGTYNTNAVWSKLFRFGFVKDLRFVEGQNINEDGFFMFQCYLKKPVMVRHSVCLYEYNTRPNSSSRQIFSEKFLSILYFCERKKELIAEHYPQYMEQAYNMEVRTNVQFLDVLCRTSDRKYEELQRKCVNTVRRLYKYFHPTNKHHKLVAWAVKHGLYPIYKWAVRMKYFR